MLSPFLNVCVVTSFYQRFANHVYLFLNLRNLLYLILTEARRIITCSDSLISEIDKEISVLSEKLNLYISLQKESCMDAVTFSEQCSKLESSLLKLKSRRKKVLAEDSDERCIDELRKLIRFLEAEPKAILVFSRPLFDKLIDKAYFEDEYVTFYLKCGLAFKERIAWN